MQSGWSGLKFCVILQPFLFLSSFKTTGMPWWLWDVCPTQVVSCFCGCEASLRKCRGKVVLSLIKHHTMKAYEIAEVWLCILSVSALDGVERLGLLINWEGALGTHWIGSWVAPRTVLETVEKKEISCLCQESNPDCSVVHRLYAYWTIPVP
jgi:hypothetical protein